MTPQEKKAALAYAKRTNRASDFLDIEIARRNFLAGVRWAKKHSKEK